MRATWNGKIIAESDRAVVVEGNHYFPPDSVNCDLLEASPTRSTCPWKGQASYWSVPDDGPGGRGCRLAYQEPSAAAQEIAGHVAFWRGVTVTG